MAWKKGINDETRQEIVSLYTEHGLGLSAISRRLDLDNKTITRALSRAGVELRPASGSDVNVIYKGEISRCVISYLRGAFAVPVAVEKERGPGHGH